VRAELDPSSHTYSTSSVCLLDCFPGHKIGDCLGSNAKVLLRGNDSVSQRKKYSLGLAGLALLLASLDCRFYILRPTPPPLTQSQAPPPHGHQALEHTHPQ
jgi:hypothetical protein